MRIIDTQFENEKVQAATMPHQIALVEQVLRVVTNQHQVKVTLGWEQPHGRLAPVTTLYLSPIFAEELANTLLAAIGKEKKLPKK